MQSRLWCQSNSRATPLLTLLWTKDAWRFASFEAYKMGGFIGRRKKTFALHFEQVQRFILVQKIFWVLRHLNNALLIQKAHWQEIREATMCSKFNLDISLKHEIWYWFYFFNETCWCACTKHICNKCLVTNVQCEAAWNSF